MTDDVAAATVRRASMEQRYAAIGMLREGQHYSTVAAYLLRVTAHMKEEPRTPQWERGAALTPPPSSKETEPKTPLSTAVTGRRTPTRATTPNTSRHASPATPRTPTQNSASHIGPKGNPLTPTRALPGRLVIARTSSSTAVPLKTQLQPKTPLKVPPPTASVQLLAPTTPRAKGPVDAAVQPRNSVTSSPPPRDPRSPLLVPPKAVTGGATAVPTQQRTVSPQRAQQWLQTFHMKLAELKLDTSMWEELTVLEQEELFVFWRFSQLQRRIVTATYRHRSLVTNSPL